MNMLLENNHLIEDMVSAYDTVLLTIVGLNSSNIEASVNDVGRTVPRAEKYGCK